MSDQEDTHMTSTSPARMPVAAAAGTSAAAAGASHAPAAAAAASSSSSASSAARPSASHSAHGPVPVKGILKHAVSRKRRSLVWDEGNLDNNEVERIERGPRMKINEPKTPYTQSHSLRSPNALQAEGAEGAGCGGHSPVSSNGAAVGVLPSELSLGDRMSEISHEALSRREHEWESDEESDSAAVTSPGHRSNQSSTGSAPIALNADGPSSSSFSSSHFASTPAIKTAAAHLLPSAAAAAASSGSGSAPETPEKQKHAEFERERKRNYHHMGDLLKAGRNKAATAAALAAANKALAEED